MTKSSSEVLKGTETIKTFFALRLKDPVIRQLANFSDSLAVYDKKVEVDWVNSENYHLTLCDTGELPITVVDELSAAAKTHLIAEESIKIHLNRIESYQSHSGWTLLVARADNSHELDALNTLVKKVVTHLGITLDLKDFKPHVTLGRLSKGHSLEVPSMWPVLDLYSLADAVILYQNKEGERGSVYTPLAIVELKDIS